MVPQRLVERLGGPAAEPTVEAGRSSRAEKESKMTSTPPAESGSVLVPWERIVADVADALIFIDVEGLIRAWNAQAEAVFGFDASEALGQSVDLIIPEHLRAAHWAGFRRAMERGRTSRGAEVRTTRGIHKEGRKLYVDMSFSVVKSTGGEVLGSAAMARDVTERYLAEKARRASAST
ncbi:MAG: PAS domain S-box protein [Sorangiineae bacterium]|nr:PAS domain S-box protein [Polyangiaceae bacterium]MEB2323914.1 PAS domain S-box protein [Sorangiineae bacterium]